MKNSFNIRIWENWARDFVYLQFCLPSSGNLENPIEHYYKLSVSSNFRSERNSNQNKSSLIDSCGELRIADSWLLLNAYSGRQWVAMLALIVFPSYAHVRSVACQTLFLRRCFGDHMGNHLTACELWAQGCSAINWMNAIAALWVVAFATIDVVGPMCRRTSVLYSCRGNQDPFMVKEIDAF